MPKPRDCKALDDLGAVLARPRDLAHAAGRGDADCFGSYHNHTKWSDGIYKPRKLVQRAIDLGFAELGITDHGYTKKGGIHCVQDSQLPKYRAALAKLKQEYSDRIRILIGLEIDVSDQNPNRLNLPLDELRRMDYLLFEYVGEPSWGGLPLGEFLEIRRRIECPVGLAHPDMPVLIANYGASFLARNLAENDVFIDACGSARNSRAATYERPGLIRKFTLNVEGLEEEFKTAARSYGLKFLPSSDTHCDNDNDGDALVDTNNAIATIRRYDLPRMVFESKATGVRNLGDQRT